VTDAELLAVRGVSKTFGSTRALADASLDVASGEVHALLGQNGSGKSTLIKILSGYHEPDAGSVRVKGENVRLPLAAHELRRRGVAFVHQDLGLVDTMSVLENLRVGRYETGVGFRIRWRSERERARRLLERFELAIDPSTPVGRLSQTARAIVAIIRALDEVEHYAGAGLLVLDEPTSALPEHEIGVLFDALRRVTEAGSAILFVTHRVEEVFAVADVVTVLRDGRRVAAEPISGLDERSLIALILGRELGELYPDVVHETAEPILSLEGVSVRSSGTSRFRSARRRSSGSPD
jgi:ribose transport system ATP-binding protein